MSIQCKDAARLVPAYLDGELSEAQAGPLRKHLLACVACRGAAQDLKGLKRWFAATPSEVGVPPGFAARVARRAFAGDTGEVAVPSSPLEDAPERSGALLPFVRELTALAAALLLMLAIGMRMGERPAGQPLRADEVPSLGEITEQLERLNAEQAQAAESLPVSDSSTPDRPVED